MTDEEVDAIAAQALALESTPLVIADRREIDGGWRFEVGPPGADDEDVVLGTSDLLVRTSDGATCWVPFGMLDDQAEEQLRAR